MFKKIKIKFYDNQIFSLFLIKYSPDFVYIYSYISVVIYIVSNMSVVWIFENFLDYVLSRLYNKSASDPYEHIINIITR